MRKLFAIFAALIAAVAFSAPAHAQFFGGGKKDYIYEKGGYAIDGYDTVAYFNLDRNDLKSDGLPNPQAVKGNPDYAHQYQGATWIFASAENLEKFKADPAKYAPAYHGYCAYAAANGKLLKTNPNAWRIIDDKLYLNFNSSIQKKWVKDIPGFIQRADNNFEGSLKGKLAAPAAS